MKTISIKKDFNQYDVGNIDKISLFKDKINVENSNEVTLNLQHCIIDYPGTSTIVDEVIRQLKTQKGGKTLIILLELDDLPLIVLNSLFHGSKELGLDTKTGLVKQKDLDEAVSAHLAKNGISIKIYRIDFDGNIVNEYYAK